MVKKLVYHLNGSYDSSQTKHSIHEILKLNNIIHGMLIESKNNISYYHKNKKWDKFKKLANDYELIFTSSNGFFSLSSHNPISRSYFKLWEILHDFSEEMDMKTEKGKKCAFLADAPGGFVEAFINYRNNNKDRHYVISLKAVNKIIPHWKLSSSYCNKNNIVISYGKKDNGDLYDLENLNSFCEEVGGNNSCDFITADGGFDFSSDFNNQEDMSLKLILCEIYTALKIQKEGGCFVLKIYDIHNLKTIKTLYILKLFYNDIYFVKPLSSRPANSEKYMICMNFKVNAQYNSMLTKLADVIQTHNFDMVLDDYPKTFIEVPLSFVKDIVEYSYVYIASQILYITKTISLIDNESNTDIMTILKEQLRKGIKWCYKYNIKLNRESLLKYKSNYFKISHQ